MNGPGLYMISGVESLTSSSLSAFYQENKLLCWGVGLSAAALIYNATKKRKSKKRK